LIIGLLLEFIAVMSSSESSEYLSIWWFSNFFHVIVAAAKILKVNDNMLFLVGYVK